MATSNDISCDWYLRFHKFIYGDDKWHLFQKILPYTAKKMEVFDVSIKAHENAISYVQGQLNSEYKAYICGIIRAFVRKEFGLPSQIPADFNQLSQLQKLGYTKLNAIDPNLLKNIRAYLDNSQLYGGPNQGDLVEVSKEDAKKDNMARYQCYDLIRSVDILYAATSSDFLRIAETYFGHAPILANLSSWWSFGGHPEAVRAQNFHLDLDDYKFCKGFIYMTDVGEKNGPHCYIPETHKLDTLVHYSKIGPHTAEEFIHWYKMTFRKTDQECYDYFAKTAPVNITGEAGTQLMVDTSGIHKGLLPEEGDRLIVQFEYCTTANPLVEVQLIPFSEVIAQREEYREHFLNPVVQYACQLLIDYDA